VEKGLQAGEAAVWLVAGFSLLLALEQLLHWHHCHRAATDCTTSWAGSASGA